MPQSGMLYDGASARAHSVIVKAVGEALLLQRSDGSTDEIPGSVLRSSSHAAGRLRIGRTDLEGWSLILHDPVDPDVVALLPSEISYGRWIDRIGLVPALLVGGILTVLVVAAGYVAPNWLAPHVPMSWERNAGSAVVAEFENERCRNRDGQRALEALVERVAPGATKGPDGIRIAAVDLPEFNAAALPGGYIVVFKPAITEADTDALAGIIAHEVAHVRRRHVTQALIRELGIGALIRMSSGDLGASAEQLVALSYTRANEAQADADAIQMLQHANISPKPTAELFHRLEREDPAYSAEFLQSHPSSSKRADRFAGSFNAQAQYQPALRSDQARALLTICETPTA